MFDSIPDNLPVVESNNLPPVTPPAEPVLPVVNASVVPRPTSDILDYVPLDEETKTSINWKKWLLSIVGLGVAVFVGWIVWFGTMPFTNKVIFNPPWQLSADKVAQYIVDDLIKSDHVKFSAVLTAEKYKVILDEQVPELSEVKADINGNVNFTSPFDSELKMVVDHDGQNKSTLNYQIFKGQSYLGGQSTFGLLKQMFNTSGEAVISLPQQTSQPNLTLAEVKDIYKQHKFLIATDLEKSTIDGKDYAMITLKSDPDIYQAFVQAIRDKKDIGLPFSNNFDMIFSPQTTIKAAIRLSDKTFRNAFIEGTHSRLGKYKLSITIDSLDKSKLELAEPVNIITVKAAMEIPQPVEVKPDTIPEGLRAVINQQSDVIKKLIGTDPQITVDFPTDYTLDSDGDGIPDAIEILIGTLPNKADSDGDGYNDLQEINSGYNPLGDGKLEFPSPPVVPTATSTLN